MADHSQSSRSNESQIQKIDRQLLQLLADRVERLRELPESHPDVNSTSDWSALLRRLNGAAGPADLVVPWLEHAASLSRRVAHPNQSICYLGPIYSFSYLAAAKYFGMGADLIPVSTISAAFEEVQRKQAAFAIVPVENNTDGRIVDTLGMFARSPVQICGEVLLPIHHCLLSQSGRQDIREVHSKTQPLSQCRHWLATHLPDVKLVEVASTAEAAATAAKTPGVAAIASREAGIHHGCRIIAENIEDNSENSTRFAVIGNKLSPPTGDDKTSLMVQIGHRPGALADAMMVFKQAGVNLTWIESFPLPNRPNEYLFFIELDGHKDQPTVSNAVSGLKEYAVRLDVLGSYPKGKP